MAPRRRHIRSAEECLTLSKADSNSSNVIFVDGSWYLPNIPDRNARKEYEAGPRIEGAKFFDVDDIASTGPVLNPKGLPHMMPPAALFAAAMDKMGIRNCDTIIVYAGKGCFAAPRTWFTFVSLGHDPSRVFIMDGGFDDWDRLGGPVDRNPVKTFFATDLNIEEPRYVAREPANIVDMAYVQNVLNESSASRLVVDARSSGRFVGTEPEPRPGLRGGHMAGSQNLFFLCFHDPMNPLRFKSIDAMKNILVDNGLLQNKNLKEVISTCGTGVTACSLVLALYECNDSYSYHLEINVYDGSWTEWGDPNSTTIVVK